MLKLLTPHLQLRTVLELQPSMLEDRGLTGLLLDMDCTLKDQYAEECSMSVEQWIGLMRAAGVKLCVVSNGRTARVKPLAQELGLDCVAGAAKPLTFGLRTAIRKMGLEISQVGMVGDQIFTDVLAGRLVGVYTVLVRPSGAKEPWYTHIKRPLERMLLRS